MWDTLLRKRDTKRQSNFREDFTFLQVVFYEIELSILRFRESVKRHFKFNNF